MYEIDEKCQKCKNNGTAICNRCDMFYDEFDPIDKPPKTNADRIRSMSDEELAEFCFRITDDVASYYGGDGYEPKYPVASKGWLDWLREEAKE